MLADVAQRSYFTTSRSLGSRPQDADTAHQRSRHRSRRHEPIQHRPAAPNGNFVMRPITQPPARARFGHEMDVPITVELRNEPAPRRGSASTTTAQGHSDVAFGRLLAVASLVTANHDGSTTPIRNGILTGPQLVDNIHVPSSHGGRHVSSDVLGYVSFGGLTIHSLGTFRIRVTLLRLGSADAHDPVTLQGGSAIQAIDSDPFVVNP
jgi:hypothetical protein